MRERFYLRRGGVSRVFWITDASTRTLVPYLTVPYRVWQPLRQVHSPTSYSVLGFWWLYKYLLERVAAPNPPRVAPVPGLVGPREWATLDSGVNGRAF